MQTIRHLTLALVSLALLAVFATPIHALTYTWDAEGGASNALDNSVNWVGDPVVNFLTGGTHDLVFGTAGSNVNMSIAGTIDVNSITYTRAISLDNGSGGASGKFTTVRGGGITITSDVTSGTPIMHADWYINYDQAVNNNSSQDFWMRRNNAINVSTDRTLTNSGTGTGWFRFTGMHNWQAGRINVVQDSLTSAISGGGGANGTLTIKRGLFGWQNQIGSPAGGTITLGYADAEADDWGALQLGAFGNVNGTVNIGDVLTVSRPIVMAGTEGTYTIRSGKNTYGGSMAARNHTIDWTGGVTGSNSLYLENTTDAYGHDNIRFSTGAINMTGKLIHVGAGNGTCTIDSVIGANVTEVIQNSASSKLILGAANLYGGNTTVQAGTLELNNVDAVQYSTLDVQGGSVTFAASGTYNLGGLTGSGNLAIGGNTLSVGGNDQTTSYGGGIGGTGGLTKVGGGTLTLSGTSSYTGATQVNNGRLMVDGTITSDTTVADGAAIGGGGTIDGSLTLSDGAQFLFDPLAILTVNGGTVTLGALSIADIVGLDATTPDGTYTLIDGSAAFIFDGVAHLGLANAYDFGIDKKIAYFEQGSLILVVATIPEPASAALLALAGLVLLRRRR